MLFFVNDFDALRLNSNALTLLLSDSSIALSLLGLLPEVVDRVFGHLAVHSLSVQSQTIRQVDSADFLFLGEYFRAVLAYDMAVYKMRFGCDYKESDFSSFSGGNVKENDVIMGGIAGKKDKKDAEMALKNGNERDYKKLKERLNSADFYRDFSEKVGDFEKEKDNFLDFQEKSRISDEEKRRKLEKERETEFVKKQLMRMAPFCGGRSVRAKLMALKIMAISLEIMAGDEEHFLPAVADIWPFLKPLFLEKF